MANTVSTLHDFKAASQGLALFAGSFDTNGASAPADVEGVGLTVTRTAAGTYSVSVAHLATDVLFLSVTRSEAAAGDFVVSNTAFDASTRSFTVTTATSAAPTVAADVAADADNRINVLLLLRTVKGAK